MDGAQPLRARARVGPGGWNDRPPQPKHRNGTFEALYPAQSRGHSGSHLPPFAFFVMGSKKAARRARELQQARGLSTNLPVRCQRRDAKSSGCADASGSVAAVRSGSWERERQRCSRTDGRGVRGPRTTQNGHTRVGTLSTRAATTTASPSLDADGLAGEIGFEAGDRLCASLCAAPLVRARRCEPYCLLPVCHPTLIA